MITDVIAKRTTTTTTATAKAAAAEPLNYYETQCPHAAAATAAVAGNNTIVSNATSASAIATESFDYAGTTAARPYSEVPGPKPLPILGNTWRFVLLFTTLKNHIPQFITYIIHSSQCFFLHLSYFYFDLLSMEIIQVN